MSYIEEIIDIDDIPNSPIVSLGFLCALVKRLGGMVKISQADLVALKHNMISFEVDEQQTFHIIVTEANDDCDQSEETHQS